MREYKFRAWDTLQKRYDYDVLMYHGKACYIDAFDALEFYDVGRFVIEQYTGLQDRNGNDIYEGDISEGEHAIYLILWDEQKAQFRAKVIKTKSVLIKHCSFPLWQYVENDEKCRFGLIGNRFDNPELLGEVRE